LIASSTVIVSLGNILGIANYVEYLCKIYPHIVAVIGSSTSLESYWTVETIMLVTFCTFASNKIYCKCLSAFFSRTGKLLTHSFSLTIYFTTYFACFGFIFLKATSTIYFLIFLSIALITLSNTGLLEIRPGTFFSYFYAFPILLIF
jgi:hypothetical protein